MTTYPTIRTIIDQLRPILPHGFTLRVSYSGAHDSGWFDGQDIVLADGSYLDFDDQIRKPVNAIVDPALSALYDELYTLLGPRFPGWEIGDGHVNGSHGYFDICSATGTISQSHVVDYNDEEDISPDEKVPF